MPASCHRCGQRSYVKYVKLNPGIICDRCEDEERNRNNVQDVWETIKSHNRQWRRRHTQNAQFDHLHRHRG